MALEVLAIGSDNLVRLDVLTNASTGAYINSAAVSFVLLDGNGNTLMASTTMNYVAASNGRYEGTIPASVTNTLTLNALYTIQITATYIGTTLFRRLSCIAKYRSSQ
jgi:hypothetical protein